METTNGLVKLTPKGFYCEAGGFFIDPVSGVDKAIITHAHSDHARGGSKSYLCHDLSKPLLRLRLGNLPIESVQWGKQLNINGVKVSLHPAGHIIGSSQIRLEYRGETWVFSGDYKLGYDGLSAPFEPLQCDFFVTESTFGLPIYHWLPQDIIFDQIMEWIKNNRADGCSSVLLAYSLGKAQRLMKALGTRQEVFVHRSIADANKVIHQMGIELPIGTTFSSLSGIASVEGAVVIAPPGSDATALSRFAPYRTAACSGWMQVRSTRKKSSVDAGFVLSDHADWKELLTAVKATNARKVFVNHGFASVFASYLREQGTDAEPIGKQHTAEKPKPMQDAE